MREGFVGVHIGAGQHAESRTKLYLEICADACRVAVDVLRKGGSALDAASQATMVLENAGETNAGYGSNLTESGTVEMDAGIMDGNTLLFGAVGAMPGIKNPILVAKLLVQEQQKGLLPLGRVPPGFLVGEGARDWAVRHGVESVNSESLISDKARKLYRHYKKKLDAFRQTIGNSHKRKTEETNHLSHLDATTGFHNSTPTFNNGTQAHDSNVIPVYAGSSPDNAITERYAKAPRLQRHSMDDGVTDTVGVVVMDGTGNVASTVSSGGIALKQPGRVGQASCFGCGCWAQKGQSKETPYTVGISTTGCGEHLVRTFLARECALELNKSQNPVDSLQKVMKEKFAESQFLIGVPEKLGGAICMHYDEPSGRGEFLWTHTTSSMGIAFQTTADEEATTRMSRLREPTTWNLPSTFGYHLPSENIPHIAVEGISFTTHPEAPLMQTTLSSSNKENTNVPKFLSNVPDYDTMHASNANHGHIHATEVAKA